MCASQSTFCREEGRCILMGPFTVVDNMIISCILLFTLSFFLLFFVDRRLRFGLSLGREGSVSVSGAPIVYRVVTWNST